MGNLHHLACDFLIWDEIMLHVLDYQTLGCPQRFKGIQVVLLQVQSKLSLALRKDEAAEARGSDVGGTRI